MGHRLPTPGLGERVMLRRYGGSKQRKPAQAGGIIVIPIHGCEPGHKVSDRATNTGPGDTRLMLLSHHNLNNERHASTTCVREDTRRGCGSHRNVYPGPSFRLSHRGPT